jgi:outer membrane biosynthesis protein TonB
VSPSYELLTDRNDRRFRRVLAYGLGISVVVHAGLFVAWRGQPGGAHDGVRAAATAPRPSDREFLAVVRIPSQAPVRIPSPPPPIAVGRLPRVVAPRYLGGPAVAVRLAKPAEGVAASRGGAPGAGQALAPLQPPVPSSLFPAWDPPPSVRGTSVTVVVWVDALGRPSGPVILSPPTPDPDFNHLLERKVRRMSFRPARIAGRAVAAWAQLTFTF